MPASSNCIRSIQVPELIDGLDQLEIGCALFDQGERLFLCNQTFERHHDHQENLSTEVELLTDVEQQDLPKNITDNNRKINCQHVDLGYGNRMVVCLNVGDSPSSSSNPFQDNDVSEINMGRAGETRRQKIETERLAALGKLTAGVAHEIKNPLNFINNFAHLSVDLMDEMIEALTPVLGQLDQATKEEIDELLGLVKQNCVKINQHGRRAEAIIRSMLSHAHQGDDNTQSACLNALVQEAIGLAKKDYDLTATHSPVSIIASLDPDVGNIECFPADLMRALLNVIGNGAQAALAHHAEIGPELKITTKSQGNAINVTIRDNGIGMEKHVLDQALTPFFTTKPPGEGTGLGLSLCHDVICRQHRGDLSIVSEPEIFTEVTLTLFRELPERRRGGRRRDDD